MSANPIPTGTITTDSRAVTPGCAFVAIKGDQFDGHDFILQAIEKGAAEIIAEEGRLTSDLKKNIPRTVAICEVKSTLTEFRSRAHQFRSKFHCPVIAVVGSVGKTTTKELIFSLLKGKYLGPKSILKTEGSQNGFLGIPITLFQWSAQTEVAVIEIGIDDLGAMEQHLNLVEPTHVILTATGPEHLHQLKTVQQAAEEELKALDYALKKKLPIALNLSDTSVSQWAQSNQTALASHQNNGLLKTYSLQSNLSPQFLGTLQPNGNKITISHDGKSIDLALPLPGEHHAHNLLAAVTMTQFFNLSADQLREGLATFKTAYGRTELHTLASGTEVIGDYYNSNPTSVTAALKLLRQKKNPKGKAYAVLGDMLELGDEEERFHREIAVELLDQKVDGVWLIGKRMRCGDGCG